MKRLKWLALALALALLVVLVGVRVTYSVGWGLVTFAVGVDGIDVLPDGRVLVTDVEHGSVVTISPDGELRTQVRSDDVVWSDGVNVMEDGRVLLTDSAIPDYLDPLLRPPSLESFERGRPYRVHQFVPRG